MTREIARRVRWHGAEVAGLSGVAAPASQPGKIINKKYSRSCALNKSRGGFQPVPANGILGSIEDCVGVFPTTYILRDSGSVEPSWRMYLVVRDARRCRAPHHEEERPHPEEHRAAMRLEGWRNRRQMC